MERLLVSYVPSKGCLLITLLNAADGPYDYRLHIYILEEQSPWHN